jgi:mannose-6-phosphate isomerase
MIEVSKGRRVEKPWGYELIYAQTERYVGKVLFVKKGSRLSLQYHRVKDESMLIFKGEAELQYGIDDTRLTSQTLSEGDCIRLKPGMRHRLMALKDTYIMEASTPELDDVVRVQDDYGRA